MNAMIRVSLSGLTIVATFAFSQVLTPSPSAPARPSPAKPPELAAAVDWFRHADEVTNIRIPGSAAFHMKVEFRANPGIDFAKRGKSTLTTGDGLYEETWVSPDKWRREVSLGDYHATEVRAGGVRKFQASSDYEPSRVLMVLRALLYPIPRCLLEPELQDKHFRWKVEHLTAGAMPYVRVSYTDDLGRYGPALRSYEFLPNGILVRGEDYNGLITSWQDGVVFHGKLVPLKFDVEGVGLEHPMVAATVNLQSLRSFDPSIFQLDGPPAEQGATLRPFDQYDLDQPASTIHFEVPKGYASSDRSTAFPVGVKVYAIAVVDRDGKTREAEMSGVPVFGQPLLFGQTQGISIGAQSVVESLWRDRYHPAMVDGKPCQFMMVITLYNPGAVGGG